MDPLSITASAITLIQAAGVITIGLRRMNQSVKTAESRITSLCDELTNLSSYLEAVERTLRGCKALDLARMDDHLWERIEVALADCQTTLNELGVLVEKLKDGTKGRGIGWRPRAALDLSVHGQDIVGFRERVNKSNWALQTMLQAITVAASMRNHASQAVLLWELRCLKATIEDTLKASSRPARGHAHKASDARVAHNLRQLAEAAEQFHSSASSTASSMGGGSVTTASIQRHSHRGILDGAMSMDGQIPEYKRDWVETYIRKAVKQEQTSQPPKTPSPPETTPPMAMPAGLSLCRASFASPARLHPTPTSFHPPPGPAHPIAVEHLDDTDDPDPDSDDDEAEFERIIPDGLEDLARERIRNKHFERAIRFLEEAVTHARSAPDTRRLQIKLALCHFLNGTWRQAEPIVTLLASGERDPVVCTLLHALSLSHLEAYSLEHAATFCEQAHKARKKWLKRTGDNQWEYSRDCEDTLGLLATIAEVSGDYTRAEIYRRRLPLGYVYGHPKGRFAFFRGQEQLLKGVFGDDAPDLSTVRDQPVGFMGVVTERERSERLELDTSKIVVSEFEPDSAICMEEEEDGLSSPVSSSTSPTFPLRRQLTRIFSPGRAGREATNPTSTGGGDDDASGSPITRWLMGRRKAPVLKRSRGLLRKRPLSPTSPDSPNGASFKLLRMEKMTMLDDSSPGLQRQILFSKDSGYSPAASLGVSSGDSSPAEGCVAEECSSDRCPFSQHHEGHAARTTSPGTLAELPEDTAPATRVPSGKEVLGDNGQHPASQLAIPRGAEYAACADYDYRNGVLYVEPHPTRRHAHGARATSPPAIPRGAEYASCADREYANNVLYGVLYFDPKAARRSAHSTNPSKPPAGHAYPEGVAELDGTPCSPGMIRQTQEAYAMGLIFTYSLLLASPSKYIGGLGTSYLAIPDRGRPSISAQEAIVASHPAMCPPDEAELPRIRTPCPSKLVNAPKSPDSAFTEGEQGRRDPPAETTLEPTPEARAEVRCADLATTLGILASIVASLSRPKDARARMLIMLKLKAISARLRRLSNDPQLIGDVQRIIDSLGGGKPAEPAETAAPSLSEVREGPVESEGKSERGKSESIKSERESVEGQEEATSSGSREKPPTTNNLIAPDKPDKLDKPVLSRTYSWVRGDEDRFWREGEMVASHDSAHVRLEYAKEVGRPSGPAPDSQWRLCDSQDGVD